MAAQQTDQEPSIEEILSSIRQIISDDDEQSGATPVPAPEPVTVAPPPPPASADVLELTQKITDDEPEPFEVDMRTAEEPEAFEEEIFDPEPVAATPPAPSIQPTPARKMESAVDTESILTKNAVDAAMSGFSELARKTAVEHSGVTLEDIVRTELKPLLRDWLDRHLPTMIERLVQEELARVSKRVLEE
jgi:cell pole-organizing protein PopZ